MLNTDLIKGAAQAAEYAGITRRTIYHLVETQRIPCIRMGTRLYFRRSELDAAFRGVSSPLQIAGNDFS